tara:strand:+ start:142 stop:849 length:708 start_codon:yes stop_codon:yes gene_type:complete
MKKLILFFLTISLSPISIGDHITYKYDTYEDGFKMYTPPYGSKNACGGNFRIDMETNEKCAHPKKKKKSLASIMIDNQSPSTEYTECPSGSQHKEKYNSIERQMRFKDRGNFNRCLIQTFPKQNNVRDGWGLKELVNVKFKCGDIDVMGSLNYNASDFDVKSSHGYVRFSLPYTSSWDIEPVKERTFCKKDKKGHLNCYRERLREQLFLNAKTNTGIESKWFDRTIYARCTEITF